MIANSVNGIERNRLLGSEKYSVLAETEESRTKFADNVLKFLVFYGFDGVSDTLLGDPDKLIFFSISPLLCCHVHLMA